MRVLVTGHKGYIGTAMVPMLIEAGHQVIGLDCGFYAQCCFGETSCQVDSVEKDIRDVSEDDLRGFDAVIHLAALSNDPLGDLNPELTLDINHRSSVSLAKAARAAGVERFLFSSSCSTYGAAADGLLLDEEAEFNPVTPYGLSKVLAERDLRKLSDDRFSPIFLRNATAYGVSASMRFDIVLNNLVAHAYSRGIVYLKSDGTAWRPIIHIDDISRAFIAVLDAPRDRIHNQAFNVGVTEENYQIRQIAEVVREAVPGSRIEFASGAAPDKRSYRVDFGKIARELPEFKPQRTARSGALELYEAYKKSKVCVQDFEGPRYKRIDHIKKLLNSNLLNRDLRWNTSAG